MWTILALVAEHSPPSWGHHHWAEVGDGAPSRGEGREPVGGRAPPEQCHPGADSGGARQGSHSQARLRGSEAEGMEGMWEGFAGPGKITFLFLYFKHFIFFFKVSQDAELDRRGFNFSVIHAFLQNTESKEK